MAIASSGWCGLVDRATRFFYPALMAKQSDLEEAVASLLRRAGIPFEREYRFHPTRRWRADFLVPPGILIEVEGGLYHPKSGHRSLGGILRDIEKQNEAVAMGYLPLRVTEKDLNGEGRWLELLTQMLRGSQL